MRKEDERCEYHSSPSPPFIYPRLVPKPPILEAKRSTQYIATAILQTYRMGKHFVI